MTTDLDSFEAQLLRELRHTVAGRSQSQRSQTLQPGRRARRRIATLSLTAAATVAVAILIPAGHTSPAYAVQNGPNGTIEVQVNKLEDAPELQQALAAHGVKADVQFLGDNMKCQPGRYQDAPSVPDSSTRFTLGQGISIVLDRRDLAHDDTVVIAASRIPNGMYAEVGIAEGPVQPCHPIPLTDRM